MYHACMRFAKLHRPRKLLEVFGTRVRVSACQVEITYATSEAICNVLRISGVTRAAVSKPVRHIALLCVE